MVQHGIWRVRSNQELLELQKDPNIVEDTEKKKLEWVGHVVRMDQGRTIKKIFEIKPEGSIRRGRARLRWLEDVEKDLQEVKVKRWREKTVNSEEWVSII